MRFPTIALSALAIHFGAHAAPEITFTSWGGSYAQAQLKTVVAPFATATGTKVNVAEYAGGLEQLRKQQASGRIEWDVVDLTMADALAACDEGLLEKIDPSILENGHDGSRPDKDYIPGGLTSCLAGTVVWSTVITYSRRAFPKQDPTMVTDLFDLQKFPGKRALQKAPEANLEWALMADGVPLESIYSVLGTADGQKRAFRKLDSIKSQIVWWESGTQPQQMIGSGEVTMAGAYSGRVYAAMMRGNSNIRYLWDGQLLNIEGLAIVKGTRNLPTAQAFVRFATRPSVMAGMAPTMAYGPTRASAMGFIDPVTMHMIPSAPWYQKRSLTVDARWWGLHGTKLRKAFAEWSAN